MGNLIWKIIFAFHMPLMFAISGSVSDEERIRNMKGKKDCSSYLLKCVVNLYGSYLFFGYVYWSVKFFYIREIGLCHCQMPLDFLLTAVDGKQAGI